MFGKKKKNNSKDDCKCTTKSETKSVEKGCHNTKASDMTSGSRSTKSCSSKTRSETKNCKGCSASNTKSCVGKSSNKTTDCN